MKTPRPTAAFVCLVAVVGILSLLLSSGSSLAQGKPKFAKELPPWLLPKNPTELEWMALEWQANEGDTEFGENQMTVNFYLGEQSVGSGVIHCDIEYLPDASAELVQFVEEGIQERFKRIQKVTPWANVKIKKRALRFNQNR